MRVTVLGSGSSGGVPMTGTGWGQCNPDNPKNYRLRPSLFVETQGKTILIDTSPDLRVQLLANDITHIDAVLYTHAHADHLHGIDDLRGINRAMEAAIPMYADQATLDEIQTRFAYVMRPLPAEANGYFFKPTLEPHQIAAGDVFDVCGLPVKCFDQDHGRSRTLGYRIGDFAYSTDLMDLPEAGFEALAGVDTWVLGVFGPRPHATHVYLERALEWIDRVSPRRAVLTHLGPDLDYDVVSDGLPDFVEASYDGFQFSLPDPKEGRA